MTDLSPQKAHRDYVSGVLFYYQQYDIQPGDPNEGDWDHAHYPIPERLGGVETILLLRQHHAVQGALQSEEFNCCCLSRFQVKYVENTPYRQLYTKWLSIQASRQWEAMDEKEREASIKTMHRGRDKPGYREAQAKVTRDTGIYACGKPVEILDIRTGRSYLFRTEREAVRRLGIPRRTLKKLFSNEKFIVHGYAGRRL